MVQVGRELSLCKVVPLSYVINRDEVPEMVNFSDEMYESNTEHFHMIADLLTGLVYKRDNSEVHKFHKFLKNFAEAWMWIDKSEVVVRQCSNFAITIMVRH